MFGRTILNDDRRECDMDRNGIRRHRRIYLCMERYGRTFGLQRFRIEVIQHGRFENGKRDCYFRQSVTDSGLP